MEDERVPPRVRRRAGRRLPPDRRPAIRGAAPAPARQRDLRVPRSGPGRPDLQQPGGACPHHRVAEGHGVAGRRPASRARCPRPSPANPSSIDGKVASVWQYVPEAADPPASAADLARLLRDLHSRPLPPSPPEAFTDPLDGVTAALESAPPDAMPREATRLAGRPGTGTAQQVGRAALPPTPPPDPRGRPSRQPHPGTARHGRARRLGPRRRRPARVGPRPGLLHQPAARLPRARRRRGASGPPTAGTPATGPAWRP